MARAPGPPRPPGCYPLSHVSTFSAPVASRPPSASLILYPAPVPHIPSVVGLSDVGKARTRNEDSLSLVPELGVAVVADGMGGAAAGDVRRTIVGDEPIERLLPRRDVPGRDQRRLPLRSIRG